MKCEIFNGRDSDTQIGMENNINQWLRQNPKVKVQFITQSESGTDVSWNITITIFYEEKTR